MPVKRYSISIAFPLELYLSKYCLSEDPNPIITFRAWGKCLGDYSKHFLNLADALERENGGGAEIEMSTDCDGNDSYFYFWGDPEALQRLAIEGLLEETTNEDEF